MRSVSPLMRLRFVAAALFAPLMYVTVTAPTASAQEKLTMAVGAFANRTGDASLEPLSKGLADMLVTDLAIADGLKLVERARLQSIVDELNLSGSKLVDPKTAQRVGRLIGADLMLVGAYAAVEPTMRLDARLITVETGEIIATAKADGPAKQFFAVEADLVKKLLKAFGVALTPIQRLRVDKPPTRSLDALKRWSEALDALDQDNEGAAKKKLEAALAADPNFRRAQQRLTELEAKLKELEARTSAVERAGGLILKPTKPAEFWSNYRVHRQRKQPAAALTDLKGLLAAEPRAIDALLAYASLATEMGRHRTGLKEVATFAPKVPPDIAAAAFAIADANADAAAQKTARLLAEARTPTHLWLRLQALGPKVNPQPTAEDKAEEVAVLHELETKDRWAKLKARFVGRDSEEAARARVAARRKHYARGGFARGLSSLPGAALHFQSPYEAQLRIAEPTPSKVRLQLGGQNVPLKYKSVRGFRRAHAIFKAEGRRGRRWKTGLQTARLSYVDGKGRPVDVTFKAWVPSVTLEGSRWPTIRVGFPGAPKTIQLWTDPVAPIWSTIPGAGLTFLPSREAFPLVSGSYIDSRRPERFQSGFRRPVIARTADGALLALGRAEFYWEKPAGQRRGRIKNRVESLAYESEAHERPWNRYPITYLFALMTSGASREAIDLALDLTSYTVKGRPTPFNDPRGAVMAAWQRQGSGDYQWLYLLAAAKGIGHRVDELRPSAAWLPAQPGYGEIFAASLAYLDGRISPIALFDRARALDAEERKGSYAHRFVSEAAAVVVLADPSWARRPGLIDVVRRGASGANVNTWEWPILAAALRQHSLRDAPQVKIGGAYLDRWEVTAAELAACIRAGICEDIRQNACGEKIFEGPNSSLCWPLQPNDYPATWVTKSQAQQFCAWRGGRLPTRRRWQAAAESAPRFDSTRSNLLDAAGCTFILFDKGDNQQRCNDSLPNANRADGWVGLAPRGAHPLGRTRSGFEQVIGNVREWVSDGDNVSVGCGYADAPRAVIKKRCVERARTESTLASGYVGFRCAYDRPPSASAEAQARSAPAPRTNRTPPRLDYVRIPGGTWRDDYESKPIKRGPRISIQANAARISATADRVVGLSKPALTSFLRALSKRGLSGEVPEHALQELVARGRLTGLSDQATFDLFLTYLEPPAAKSGRPLRTAMQAISKEASRRLKITVYDGVYSNAARAKKVTVAELSTRDRRQAMFDWLMAGNGNRKLNLERSLIVDLQPPSATAWWYMRGCLAQTPGRCLDPTGSRSDIERPYPSKKKWSVKPFELMRTEVTQAMFAAVTGRRPSVHRCETCAVTQVGYGDAQGFCQKVGARLPTELEMQWAARGGRTVDHRPGPGFEREIAFLWNAGARPPKVGRRKANPYGLHDILGGVWEWSDKGQQRRRDYQRHVWGGSWRSDPRAIHPDISVELNAERSRSDFVGFRCAR